MLLHLIPRMYAYRQSEPECSLIDFECPDLGLMLRNGHELVARRPYPNKNYLVACRKIGQKAIDGILIETPARMQQFSTITRWAVGAERVVSHKIRYEILDSEMDAITGNMVLWHSMSPGLGGFANRWPTEAQNWTPASSQPRMELVPRERDGNFTDSLDALGRVTERSEVFQLRTVERERVLYRSECDLYSRNPTADMAFTPTR